MSPPTQTSGVTSDLRISWLGQIKFPDALALQEDIVARKREDRALADKILLLEHEPVYTIGRTPDKSSLLGAAHLPHPVEDRKWGSPSTDRDRDKSMGYPI